MIIVYTSKSLIDLVVKIHTVNIILTRHREPKGETERERERERESKREATLHFL